MLDKLAQIETRYDELTNELSSAELLSNPSAYAKAAKQHRSLEEIVEKYRALKSAHEELTGARELFDHAGDEDMRELAREGLTSVIMSIDSHDAARHEKNRGLPDVCRNILLADVPAIVGSIDVVMGEVDR